MNQRDSLLEILSDGVSYTMDQLIGKVKQHTGHPTASRNSLLVQISKLRKDGYRIESTRAEGQLNYKLKGPKGRKRGRTRVTA